MSDKNKNEGKGWGDGKKVTQYNKKRMSNPENTYTGFRPRVENEAAWYVMRQWCDREDINLSFSALINAILPGLKVSLENTTEISHGQISIELNLGRIEIKR